MDSIIDFTQFPNLDVGQRNGATDYIDYLKWDEVKESVMVELISSDVSLSYLRC